MSRELKLILLLPTICAGGFRRTCSLSTDEHGIAGLTILYLVNMGSCSGQECSKSWQEHLTTSWNTTVLKQQSEIHHGRLHTCSRTRAVVSPAGPLDRLDTHPGLGWPSGRHFQPPGLWLVGSASQKQQRNRFPSGWLWFGVNRWAPLRSVSPPGHVEMNLDQSYF